MDRIHPRRLSPATVISCIALFVSLGGVGYAAATIGSAQIKNNAVQGKDIKNSSVTGKDIKTGSVSGSDVKNNGLTGTDVNEASLGQVPSAAQATSATNAASATNATNATTAADADGLGGKSLNQVVMWAVVNTAGTLNRSSGSGITSDRLSLGSYRVTFPINVRDCAYVATAGSPNALADAGSLVKDFAVVAPDSTNVNGVRYATIDPGTTGAAALEDEPVYLVVHC